MPSRSTSVSLIPTFSACDRQGVPECLLAEAAGEVSEDSRYMQYLYGQAEIAQQELDDIARRALDLVNATESIQGIIDQVHAPVFDRTLLDALVESKHCPVHRTTAVAKPQMNVGRRKAKARSVAKVKSDYVDKPPPHETHLLDLTRMMIYCNDPLTMTLVYSLLCAFAEVVRTKNRFFEPTGFGYRDIMLNVRVPCGHITEVQMTLTEFALLKDWQQPFYEMLRTATETDLLHLVLSKGIFTTGVQHVWNHKRLAVPTRVLTQMM